MVPARQTIVLVAVGLVAVVVGFAGAAALESSSAPGAAIPPEPAALPEEALPPPAPPERSEAPGAPAATSAVTAPAPPAPVAEAPATLRRSSRRAPAPARRVTTAPPRAPAASQSPAPAPAAPSATAPPPAPVGPPQSALAAQPDPPAGVRIPAGSALTGYEPARRALATALAASEPGSVTHDDVARQLSLWTGYLGPDAAPAPPGRRATIARALRANAWWYGRRGAPSQAVLLRDEDGVLLTYRPRQGFVVNPVATTGRWRRLNDDVPATALAQTLSEMAVTRRAGERHFLAWEYYDVPGEPSAIRPGASGMAQARLALLMAHAADDTGDPRFTRMARGALAAFTVDVDRGGVRSMVSVRPDQSPTPWYVERAYPGENPWTGAALNGFMVTLLNLRGAAALLARVPGADPAASTASALALDLAERGEVSLERHLPDHDTGAWSYYGLLTPGRPWKTHLADLNYHCYHVHLLRQLAEASPDLGFADVAARWQSYVDAAGLTCPVR